MHLAHLLTAALSTLPIALSAPCYGYNTTLPTTPGTNTTLPACSLSTSTLPPSALTPPESDMRLALILRGIGTQNYTCTTNATSPTAIGALASLYDVSCSAGSGGANSDFDASVAEPVGTHFFSDSTTPDFDIPGVGVTKLAKKEDVAAPVPERDVRWLMLDAKTGGDSDVRRVYRVHTEGGLAPGSCEGIARGEVITVGYEAEYWVYE